MSALTEALAAVQNGTGCPHCLVGCRDVMSDPMFNCDVCHGTDVPHFALLSAAEELLAACKEFVRKCESGEARSVRSYAQMSAAIAKAEGR